jgi:hypothetical protein
MGSIRTIAAGVAGIGLAAGMLVFAPVASADNYAPQLPSNIVKPGQKLSLTISGAQPGCRVTYTIRGKKSGTSFRLPVGDDGVASAKLRAPLRRGTYALTTRVDNFPGKTGCTPTKSVQRLRVT